MGARLCCFRESSSEYAFCDQIETPESMTENYRNSRNARRGRTEHTTLREYLLASPSLIHPPSVVGSEVQVIKPRPKRVQISSPEEIDFFTPRISFSKRLEKIDELGEDGICRSPSVKLKRKVTFKLPDEADIIFYTPREILEE